MPQGIGIQGRQIEPGAQVPGQINDRPHMQMCYRIRLMACSSFFEQVFVVSC